MDIQIFTIPFDHTSKSFSNDVVTQFCKNKKVIHIQTQFFHQGDQPFWSVAVQYERASPSTKKPAIPPSFSTALSQLELSSPSRRSHREWPALDLELTFEKF